MEDERMLQKIFWEAQVAKDKARGLAGQQFPSLLSLNKADEYSRYVEKTENRLLKELRIKYEITESQLDAIKREGILKNWSSLSEGK